MWLPWQWMTTPFRHSLLKYVNSVVFCLVLIMYIGTCAGFISEFCSRGANASGPNIRGGGGQVLLYYCINITFHITYFKEQQTKFLEAANQFLGGGGGA